MGKKVTCFEKWDVSKYVKKEKEKARKARQAQRRREG